MYQNLLEFLNYRLGTFILGYFSESNGGDFCVTNKRQTRYRGLGETQWFHWNTTQPNVYNRCLEAATPNQVTSEVFNRVLSLEDPEYAQVMARKDLVLAALGEKYHLGRVGTLLGWLPVISKEQPETKYEVPVAHLYPGELTDALDAAPKKNINRFFEIPEQELYSWLATSTNKSVIDAVKQAIVTLERPERYIPYYEKTE
jgi:hypothetical protein